MAFSATCSKILKGRDVSEPGQEALKRSCDVVASKATRCLELSVKDFLSVLKDDIVGCREALRAISNMKPLIDKRRHTVNSIKDGSFAHDSGTSADEHHTDTDFGESKSEEDDSILRSHTGYQQDIILTGASQEMMRRRLEKSKSHGRYTHARTHIHTYTQRRRHIKMNVCAAPQKDRIRTSTKP